MKSIISRGYHRCSVAKIPLAFQALKVKKTDIARVRHLSSFRSKLPWNRKSLKEVEAEEMSLLGKLSTTMHSLDYLPYIQQEILFTAEKKLKTCIPHDISPTKESVLKVL
jgi:hypothetical protein